MSNFVLIQSGNFRALVRFGNLAKVKDKLAKVKPPVMDHGLTMYQANPLADKLLALFGGDA